MDMAETTSSAVRLDPVLIFPPEVMLQAVSYLPIDSVSKCYRVSKSWNALLTKNEGHIYCGLAVHQLKATDPCKNPNEKHPNWKSVAQCQFQTTKNWKYGNVTSTVFKVGRGMNFRFKVDESEGLLFSSAFEPINHLYVTDLRTGHTLQTFSNLDNPWMHLEYDNGYLVGPTDDSKLFVWKVVPLDVHTLETPSSVDHSERDHAQDVPSADRLIKYGEIDCLKCPFRALRLVGDELVTAGPDCIYTYNIPELRLESKIPCGSLGISEVTYVEFDDEYIFLCAVGMHLPGNRSIYVFKRKTRALHTILTGARDLNSGEAGDTTFVVTRDFADLSQYVPNTCPGSEWRVKRRHLDHGMGQGEAYKNCVVETDFGIFTSCHYSNDHLFITENGNDAGTVHILRDYKAALNDLERLDDYWMCIFLDGFDPLYQGTTATHFALPLYAFRGSDTSEDFVQSLENFWLIIATDDIPPVKFHSSTSDTIESQPDLSVTAISKDSKFNYNESHCVQATDNSLYLTEWPRHIRVPDAHNAVTIERIDFRHHGED